MLVFSSLEGETNNRCLLRIPAKRHLDFSIGNHGSQIIPKILKRNHLLIKIFLRRRVHQANAEITE